MSTAVRAGLVGLGRLGRIHAENLAGRVPGVELVRVADADGEIARRVGERLGVPSGDAYAGILADPDVDAVVIVSPTGFHAEMVAQAAQAGKDIFCEKPLALDIGSTRRAIEAAREAGVKLQVGLHRRFDPDWAAAQRRIRSGDLGRPYLFRTSLRDMAPPPPDYLAGSGGFFVDVTIHDFDTARWMMGEIREVTAFGAGLSDPLFAQLGDIDNAVVVCRFASGALGVIDNSRVAGYGYEASTEVVGSSATLRIDHPWRHHVTWLAGGRSGGEYAVDFTERFAAAYVEELAAFGRAVRGKEPVPVTGEDAEAAFVLAKAATASFERRAPVTLEFEGGRYAFAGLE